MSDKYLPGDKVRVTIEGTVHRHCGHSLELRNEFGNASHEIFTNQSDVKVEKIEPPVEVFKPGDLIRHKGSQVTFLVTSEGYVDMTSGGGYDSFRGTHRVSPSVKFTSKHYERVNVG